MTLDAGCTMGKAGCKEHTSSSRSSGHARFDLLQMPLLKQIAVAGEHLNAGPHTKICISEQGMCVRACVRAGCAWHLLGCPIFLFSDVHHNQRQPMQGAQGAICQGMKAHLSRRAGSGLGDTARQALSHRHRACLASPCSRLALPASTCRRTSPATCTQVANVRMAVPMRMYFYFL